MPRELRARLDVHTSNPLNGSQGQTIGARRARARERRNQRGQTAFWCRVQMGFGVVELPCVITLTRVAPRRLDDDGWQAAAKPIRDGVADWLGVKDNDQRVTWNYAQRRGRVREYAVEIVITRLQSASEQGAQTPPAAKASLQTGGEQCR